MRGYCPLVQYLMVSALFFYEKLNCIHTVTDVITAYPCRLRLLYYPVRQKACHD